ncbi:hypothetical protein SLS58_001430 [Diplodia intermedia]|uniref:Uncharacterized protein n=1 Tax=Diplodia intermedia TaxID=856260 RepID=A0ABR3U2X2_9PEZI
MLIKAGLLPFGLLWILLLFGLIVAPVANSRALAVDNNNSDVLVHALPNITKLMKKDVTHACDISACDIDEDLCRNDDEDGGDDYDENCDEDNLDDCPPEQDTMDFPAGGRREYDVHFPRNTHPLTIQAMNYPAVGKVLKSKNGRLVYPYAMKPENLQDCESTSVLAWPIRSFDPPENTVTEHILELQTISMWMTELSAGTLDTPSVNDACFLDYWNEQSLPSNVPKMQSGTFKTSRVPNDRVFEALGSFRNRGILLVADSQIWRDVAIISNERMAELADNAPRSDEDAGMALGMVLLPILVFDYLNNPETSKRMYDAADGVRDQLELIENNISECSGLAASWDVFLPKILKAMPKRTKLFIGNALTTVNRKMREAVDNDPGNADLKARWEAAQSIIDSLATAGGEKVKTPER